jgi:tRNA1Val (adenine37-N6)-methyltransferase
MPRAGETPDTIFNGRLKIFQPRKGYRFSIDSVLLAGLTRTRPKDRIADLGTGCGVVSLLLACKNPTAHVTGIEIQKSLVSLARRNVTVNRLSHRVRIIQGDLREVRRGILASPIDLVVSNPPYRELQTGRINPDTEKAVARHEILASLTDVVKAADKLLDQSGRLALIYPARRLPHLFTELGRRGFAPKRLTLIHATLSSTAKLAHLESIRGGGDELVVVKSCTIYRSDGEYTEEVAAMYESALAVS